MYVSIERRESSHIFYLIRIHIGENYDVTIMFDTLELVFDTYIWSSINVMVRNLKQQNV